MGESELLPPPLLLIAGLLSAVKVKCRLRTHLDHDALHLEGLRF